MTGQRIGAFCYDCRTLPEFHKLPWRRVSEASRCENCRQEVFVVYLLPTGRPEPPVYVAPLPVVTRRRTRDDVCNRGHPLTDALEHRNGVKGLRLQCRQCLVERRFEKKRGGG